MENTVNTILAKKLEDRKECIDEMIEIYGVQKVIAFCLCSAYKYRYRMGTKPGEDTERELQKVRWYENKAKELMNRNDI